MNIDVRTSFVIILVTFLLLVGSACATPFAYVASYGSNTISVIDLATNHEAALNVGTKTVAIAANLAGTRVYVTTDSKNNSVLVIDTATNTAITAVPVGLWPVGVAVNPAGTRVYVANQDDNTVSVIDTSSNTVITTVPVGILPEGVAVNPTGTKVYVANHDSNNVSVIDIATNKVTAIENVGDGYPSGVAMNPTGTKVYVANDYNDLNCNNSLECGTVSVINASSNTVNAKVYVGLSPQGVAVDPTGTKVYVTGRMVNTVTEIDGSSNNFITALSVGALPSSVAVNPAGTKVYVSNQGDNDVSVIDTSSNLGTPMSIGVEASPTGICVVTPPHCFRLCWSTKGVCESVCLRPTLPHCFRLCSLGPCQSLCLP